MGAWISYGLGIDYENLPAFVALSPGGNGAGSLPRSDFLPTDCQGTAISDSEVEPENRIAGLRNRWLDAEAQRRQVDAVLALSRGCRAASARPREPSMALQRSATDACAPAAWGERCAVRAVCHNAGQAWDDHKKIEQYLREHRTEAPEPAG